MYIIREMFSFFSNVFSKINRKYQNVHGGGRIVLRTLCVAGSGGEDHPENQVVLRSATSKFPGGGSFFRGYKYGYVFPGASNFLCQCSARDLCTCTTNMAVFKPRQI